MSEDTSVKWFDVGQVRFKLVRCYGCGRWWGYETFAADSPGCPVCGGKETARLRDELSRLGRAIAALKGALRRRKARR